MSTVPLSTKVPAVLGIFLLTLWGSGCEPNSADDRETANAPMVIEPTVSVGNIRAGMTVKQVLAQLGEPARRTVNSLEYPRLGLAVIQNREGIIQGVMCGDVTGTNGPFAKAFNGRTKEGIGMNSTREQIFKAYGEPSQQDKSPSRPESLTYDTQGLTFTLEGGRVHHIAVRFATPQNPDRTVTLEPTPTQSPSPSK